MSSYEFYADALAVYQSGGLTQPECLEEVRDIIVRDGDLNLLGAVWGEAWPALLECGALSVRPSFVTILADADVPVHVLRNLLGLRERPTYNINNAEKILDVLRHADSLNRLRK